ncbi:hypothetical protein BFG05_06470 [Campylobacter pinnipediorum subsp. pinnipediorum]|nr:hypothetical protein BFG05_06470 [Campylobacter pinnipediorum subsp. pinnipediorum]
MVNILDFDKQKAQILYPIFWEYKVIYDSEVDIDNKIKEILGKRDCLISFSKFSKDKKYKSYNLSVFVKNEAERLEVFSLLKKSAKYVL